MKENLQIQSKPITIRVMEVDGARMGMGIFKQIPFANPFGPNFEFDKIAGIGFVRIKSERYLLFSDGGVLFKHSITSAFSFAYGERYWDVEHICVAKGIYADGPSVGGILGGQRPIEECYNAADVAKIRSLQLSARVFFGFIETKQIYI